MVFITPKPSFEILETFYFGNYSMYKAGSINPEREAHSLKYKIARLRYASFRLKSVNPILQEMLAILIELLTGKTVSYSLGIPLQLSSDAHIFELGFGAGAWLESMSSLGYRYLYGYDISSNLENVGRIKNLGIEVTTGDFLKNTYPDNYFDLVRLEHVFEHLLEPMLVIQRIYGMLKPGGALVLNFPSSEGFAFALSPKHCFYRDSPRHLFLHTKYSAKKILQAAGFEKISCRSYGVALDLEATVNNMLKERHWGVRFRFLGSAIGPLYKIFSYFFGQRGDYITMMAIK
jgi:SAM-dependent methyltransferase